MPANKAAAKTAFADYIKPLTTAKDVRKINADLYDFATTIYARRKQNTAFSIAKTDLKPLSEADETEVWKQLFYHTITGHSKVACNACSLLLLGNFVIKNAAKTTTEDELKELSHAKVIIPTEVVALRQEMLSLYCVNGGLMGVTKLGFADYMRVEQELLKVGTIYGNKKRTLLSTNDVVVVDSTSTHLPIEKV